MRVVFLFSALSVARTVSAQCPPCPPVPPPPPVWNISLGGGLSLTGGNTDTSSYNLLASAVHDPKTKNIFRFEALYLRTEQEDLAAVDRTFVRARDEYTVNGRLFAFGELGYLRDQPKEVDYLISPVAGLGYRLVDRPRVVATVDGGLGVAFEKLTGQDSTTDVAVQATERVDWKATSVATLYEKASGLWKAGDFGDAYYRAEIGVSTTLAKRLELKLAFADDYKTRPPSGLKKNDTSFLMSVVFKP
jgi:putative salt-induced outer membrane protein